MALSVTKSVSAKKGEFYNWERLWKPIDAKQPDFDRDGFLIEKSDYSNTELEQLDKLEEKDYLILIGEPGIGKTKICDQLKSKFSEQKKQNFILIEFKTITDLYSIEKLFINKVNAKLKETNQEDLYVYLDGLDESIFQFPAVVSSFASSLDQLKEFNNRLKLRITCRTINLPDELESKLKEFYNITSNQKNCFELQPLTRQDVETAAKEEALNPNAFIDELIEKDAVPFAIKPISLAFLLKTFGDKGKLSKYLKDIYKEGLLHLCKEPNKFRNKEARHLLKYKLVDEQRLIIAGRIAALSIFCKKPQINIDKIEDYNLPLGDIVGYNENVKEVSVEVNNDEAIEVLSTALFGLDGFSHKSYAEFLAAYYLYKNEVPLNVVQNFFFNELNKVYPQLVEVAVWYTHFNESFLADLIEKDYEVLLDKNTNHVSPEKKENLIDRYITDLNNANASNNVYISSFKKRFHYDGLTEKITKELNKSSNKSYTKGFLIELAHFSNQDHKLQNAIFGIAKSEKTGHNLKCQAIEYIGRFGDKGTFSKLIPLLNDITVSFSNIKNPNFILKTLKHFLNQCSDIKEFVLDRVVINAFKTIANNETYSELKGEIENIIFKLIAKYILKVPYNITEVLIPQLKKADGRKKFFEKLISEIVNINEVKSDLFLESFGSLCSKSDWNWSLEKFERAENLIEKKCWFILIKRIIDDCRGYTLSNEDLNEFKKICTTTDYAIFADDCNNTIKKYKNEKAINDQYIINQAKRDKEEIEKEKSKQKALEKELKIKIEEKSWNGIAHLLKFKVLFGSSEKHWSSIEENLKHRIVEIAKEYKKEDKPFSFEAIFILYKADKRFLKIKSIFSNWINYVFDNYPNQPYDKEKIGEITEYLYHKSPLNSLISIKHIYDKLYNKVSDYYHFANLFSIIDQIQDSHLNCFFYDLIIEKNNFKSIKHPNLFYWIVRKLITQKYKPLLDDINYWLKNGIQELDFENLRFVFKQSFVSLNEEHRNAVLNKLMQSKSFEKYFIEKTLKPYNSSGENKIFFKQLENVDFQILKEWYCHLEETFKPNNSNNSFQSKVRLLKNRLIDTLISKSKDFEIIELLKNDIYKHKIRYAIKIILPKNWQPPNPQDLLQSIKKHKRTIQTEEHLSDLIYETLEQLQKDFKEEIEPIANVWGSIKNKVRGSLSEDDISNYVKSYLKRQLLNKAIIVNRELQVNTKESSKGKSADFFVEVIAVDKTGKNKQLTVIIEAKGCWYDKIQTSMESQLINDYLQNSKSKNGIYLIYYVLDSKLDKNCIQFKKSKRTGKFQTLDGYKNVYGEQAEKMSEQYNLNIKSFVLDCTFDQLEK